MKQHQYGLMTAIAMIVGVVIGSGIFFKSDNVLVATGGNVALGAILFAVAAISIIFGSLAIGELASKSDPTQPGGIIAYMDTFYNGRFACAIGWFQVMLYFPTILAVISWVGAVYIFSYLGLDFGAQTVLYQVLLGFVIMSFFFGINSISARFGGTFQTLSMIIKLIPLLLIACAGMFSGNLASTLSASGAASGASASAALIHSGHSAATGAPAGISWISALVPIVFAFDGWVVSTAIGSELKHPRRNLPLALSISGVFILMVYLMYFLGVSALLPPEQIIAEGDMHLFTIAQSLLGPIGARGILLLIIISVLGGVNGMSMAYIRLPHSLAVRGMLPRAHRFASRDARTGLPMRSAALGYGVSVAWLILHYITLTFGLLPNSDVSEISISLGYIFYMLLYVKVIALYLRGEVKGVRRGVIYPVLAVIGSLIILVAAAQNPLFLYYLAFSSLVVLAAMVFMTRRRPDAEAVSEDLATETGI